MSSLLRLSPGQQRLYALLLREMTKGSDVVPIPLAYPQKSVILLVKLVLGEHPELIGYNNCSVWLEETDFSRKLFFESVFQKGELPEMRRQLERETQNILRRILRPGAGKVQKVLSIHDYLTQNVSYDEDEYAGRRHSVLAHMAFGAIVQKRAVCEGIAYGFCHLARRAGIEATVVNGMANGEKHAWNIIKIGSEFFHLDVTWDMKRSLDPSVRSYDYFCLKDSDLQSRKWDRRIYPPCISDRYSYFVVTNTFAHNRQQLRSMMLRQYRQDRLVYLKCDFLPMDEQDMMRFLINELQEVAWENGISIGNISVMVNQEQGTVFCFHSE